MLEATICGSSLIVSNMEVRIVLAEKRLASLIAYLIYNIQIDLVGQKNGPECATHTRPLLT